MISFTADVLSLQELPRRPLLRKRERVILIMPKRITAPESIAVQFGMDTKSMEGDTKLSG